MSGMFQRIARRHTDSSDERVASETPGAAPDGATPSADVDAQPPAGEPGPQAADADSQPPASETAPDAPTERIEIVAPPAPVAQEGEQPTVLQPAVEAPSAPPPTIDLRSRLGEASVPAPAPGQVPQPAGDLSAAPVPTVAPAPVAAQAPAPGAAEPAATPRRPGFRARGRMRRRLRYLRRLRELQVRDLGGLVFDLRRFERKRDDLVLQKVDQIRACDDELHALERALGERRDLRDVREPGIGGTCPRCFAIFGSADRFCASCGAALGGAVQGPAQVPLAPPPASDAGSPR